MSWAGKIPPTPLPLVQLATLIGSRADLVQGAGGNISFKEDNTIWVKASGTRLKDATKSDIFVAMELSKTREQVLLRENLTDLCATDSSGRVLRPSIETAIHALLPQKYVIHVHSIGAISKAIDADFEVSRYLPKVPVKIVQIGYAKPGIPLAKAILEEIDSSLTSVESLLVLLGNHGMIAAASSAEAAIAIILQTESDWASQFKEQPSETLNSRGWLRIYAPGFLSSRQSEVLTSGVLTPDEAVFLGPIPFGKDHETSNLPESIQVACETDGSVWARREISTDALEIARSFICVVRNLDEHTRVRYLTDYEVQEILGWDAEKWRQQVTHF